MDNRGGTDKERLARVETKLDFICEGMKESKEQWLWVKSLGISNTGEKVDALFKNQKDINDRLIVVELHIKRVQWVGAGVAVILPVIAFISRFFTVKIDSDKVIPLGVIDIIEVVEVFI